LALHSSVEDEFHVMRKIVIDGSNTTGFQRTMLIARGGYLNVGGEKIGVQSVCLEEDAAKIVKNDKDRTSYSLDRLGIPLVEVTLEPISAPGDVVTQVALALGRLLRSTKRVARGIGSIRQDVNISIDNLASGCYECYRWTNSESKFGKLPKGSQCYPRCYRNIEVIRIKGNKTNSKG
jgi:glutamyl-tRNA(Gln) amidotransferase subunit E